MEFEGISLASLLKDDRSHKLVLPNFQRDFVWSKNEQQSLVASFVANIPIGSILVLEGKRGDFASRPLAFDRDTEPAYECRYLLDGQQRIACLKTVFSDVYADYKDWLPCWEATFNLLRHRWFLRVVPQEAGDLDLFNWESLYFDEFPSDLTPQDVVPLIAYQRINKTQPTDWHHPNYQHCMDPELTPDQRRLRVGREAAERGLIPLWEVLHGELEGSDPLHYHALRELANRRAADLKAETGGDQEAWIRVLRPIEPSIEEHLGDPKRIDEAWSTLRVRWMERVGSRLEQFLEHKIPMAQVPPNQPERAIAIFENINLGGTRLTVFDLVVAKAALGAEGERSLRRKIVDQLQEAVEVPAQVVPEGSPGTVTEWESESVGLHDNEAPAKTFRNQYLNLLSIVGHLEYPNTGGLSIDHIKKTKQLSLSAEQINGNTRDVVKALKRAFLFLHLRCGMVTLGDLSYDLMVLPIAFVLNDNKHWKNLESLSKLEYWFWVSLFGGTYRERQNRRCVDDLEDLVRWVTGDSDNPFESREERLFAVEDYSDKDTLLLTKFDEAPPPAAIRTGIMQFIVSRCPEDWLPRDRFDQQYLTAWNAALPRTFTEKDGKKHTLTLQEHHIVPLASATKLGESASKLREKGDHILNSPLNLTPISDVANGIISGKSPQQYIEFLDELAVADHYVPADISKKLSGLTSVDSKNETEVYRELLEERFKMLRMAVKARLRALLK